MIHYSHKGLWARSGILAGVIVLLQIPPLEAQITLREATRRAVSANRGIRGAESTLDARSAGVRAAQGHLLPSIEVNAAYTYLNDDLVLELDPIRNAMISLEISNQEALKNLESLLTQGRPLSDAERAAVSGVARQELEAGLPHFNEVLKDQAFLQGVVTARQPLFTGGKILAGIRAARAQEDGAEAALDAEREAVMAETAQRYLDVLLARETLLVRREAAETFRRHQERATRLLEEGVIAQHEKMRADVALAEAERAESSAREYLRIAQVGLTSVLGETFPLPEGEPQELAVSEQLAFGEVPLSLAQPLDALQEGNSALRQLRAGARALEERAQARKAEFFPTLYGFGMYNLFDEYMIEGAEPKWALGIGVSFNLFNGLRRKREWEEAHLESSALKDRTEETGRKLRLMAQSARMQMVLAEDQYRQLTAALNQAEENLRLNTRRFDEGLGTSLEVVDARLSLNAVRLQRAAALHSHFSRQVDLFHLMGAMERFLDHWDSVQRQHA